MKGGRKVLTGALIFVVILFAAVMDYQSITGRNTSNIEREDETHARDVSDEVVEEIIEEIIEEEGDLAWKIIDSLEKTELKEAVDVPDNSEGDTHGGNSKGEGEVEEIRDISGGATENGESIVEESVSEDVSDEESPDTVEEEFLEEERTEDKKRDERISLEEEGEVSPFTESSIFRGMFSKLTNFFSGLYGNNPPTPIITNIYVDEVNKGLVIEGENFYPSSSSEGEPYMLFLIKREGEYLSYPFNYRSETQVFASLNNLNSFEVVIKFVNVVDRKRGVYSSGDEYSFEYGGDFDEEGFDLKVVHITPTTGYVQDSNENYIYGSQSSPAQWPLAWAIKNANDANGRRIDLYGTAGRLVFEGNPANSFMVDTMDSSKNNPIIISGKNGATIDALGSGDTISIISELGPTHPFNYIIWKDLTIIPGYRSAIHLGALSDSKWTGNPGYKGWEFDNVIIDGLWSHKDNSGPINTKWGIQLYSSNDFVYKNGIIRNIEKEHAIYMHHPAGPTTIENNEFYQLGRTAVQVTSRKNKNNEVNMPANPFPVDIKNNIFADTGLEEGGFFGGQTVTIVGRNTGTINVTGNYISYCEDLYTLGLCEAVQQRMNDYFNPDKAYGSGATVSWTTLDEEYEISGRLIYAYNKIVYGTNSNGDAGTNPAVSISAVDTAEIYWNTIRAGADKNALIIGEGKPQTHPTPNNYCATNNVITNGGRITIGGTSGSETQPIDSGGSAVCPPQA